MLTLFLVCLLLLETAADSPYSDSYLLINNINLYVDGIFSDENGARVNVDFETNYGFPRGTKTKRSSTTVNLYRDGYERFRMSDVQFFLENPLSFIRSTAYVEITYVFNNRTPDVMKRQLFDILNVTFDNADDKYLNISLDKPNWYLALAYKKGCDQVDYFGFDCSAYCPKPATAIECYTCQNVTGQKKCCKDSAYDQETCHLIDPDGNGHLTPLEACQKQLSQTKDDYDYQNKWRKIFFWLLILFVVLALVLLAIIFCCLFSTLHYKQKSENSQQIYPNEDEWKRTTTKSTREHHNNSNYNDVYKQPVRAPTQKRRSMSIASIESEFRVVYPPYESPVPRRRNEQLV